MDTWKLQHVGGIKEEKPDVGLYGGMGVDIQSYDQQTMFNQIPKVEILPYSASLDSLNSNEIHSMQVKQETEVTAEIPKRKSLRKKTVMKSKPAKDSGVTKKNEKLRVIKNKRSVRRERKSKRPQKHKEKQTNSLLNTDTHSGVEEEQTDTDVEPDVDITSILLSNMAGTWPHSWKNAARLPLRDHIPVQGTYPFSWLHLFRSSDQQYRAGLVEQYHLMETAGWYQWGGVWGLGVVVDGAGTL